MKQKLSLLSFLCFFTISVHAQWDGAFPMEVPIDTLQGQIFQDSIAAIGDMNINGIPLNTSCAQNGMILLSMTYEKDSAKVVICNDTLQVRKRNKKWTITNGDGVKLDLIIEDKTPDFDFGFNISRDTFYVYYDALVLLKGSLEQKKEIYAKYNMHKNTSKKFFTPSIISDISQRSDLQSGGQSTTSSATSAVSSLGGLNVTKLADGFAKFLANRFKKELTISFFNRFKEKLNSDDVRDLRTLFKNTTEELNLIDDQFTHYEAYLSSLRQSMEIDCHNIPVQFRVLLEDPNSQLSEALRNEPDFQYVMDNVLTFALELKDSIHIGTALGNLDLSKNVNPVNPVSKNVMGSFQTIQLISEGMKNINAGPNEQYWISDNQISTLLTDGDLMNIFFGLLAEKSKLDTINFSGASLFDIMISKKASEIKGLVESMITSIKSIEDIYDSSGTIVSAGGKDALAMKYFDAASSLINTSKHLKPLLPEKDAAEITKFNTLASNINDMTRAFVTKNYSIGLLYLSNVLTSIDSSSTAIKKVNTVLGNQGLFVAQMAESTNSDDVANILENFAAPTGSWRDKRKAKWNIALDSYVGPAYYDINENDRRIAFSSPIGFSLTTPIKHVTFMFSAVDLGPITSFRLTDDTTQIANIYLKEIIAPGVFASVWLGENFPVTINLGYQQFPLLEKVGTSENTVNITRDTGFSGSIVINIPIFTLYNDPKN